MQDVAEFVHRWVAKVTSPEPNELQEYVKQGGTRSALHVTGEAWSRETLMRRIGFLYDFDATLFTFVKRELNDDSPNDLSNFKSSTTQEIVGWKPSLPFDSMRAIHDEHVQMVVLRLGAMLCGISPERAQGIAHSESR